ncbi:hypothetical protein M514_25671 [Trichuris suis]|uniref:Uncharacterized protein n=1 Tax=Trichuris suis TaxID=68888 RepID=A0A085MY90_9BILA|nr:hypothetical protein M514_25671 [Trichuris suis]
MDRDYERTQISNGRNSRWKQQKTKGCYFSLNPLLFRYLTGSFPFCAAVDRLDGLTSRMVEIVNLSKRLMERNVE